jgi:hypothetical protein
MSALFPVSNLREMPGVAFFIKAMNLSESFFTIKRMQKLSKLQ